MIQYVNPTNTDTMQPIYLHNFIPTLLPIQFITFIYYIDCHFFRFSPTLTYKLAFKPSCTLIKQLCICFPSGIKFMYPCPHYFHFICNVHPAHPALYCCHLTYNLLLFSETLHDCCNYKQLLKYTAIFLFKINMKIPCVFKCPDIQHFKIIPHVIINTWSHRYRHSLLHYSTTKYIDKRFFANVTC